MRKVLVFGAAGFIGSALVRKLLKQSIEVIAVIPTNKIQINAKEKLKKYDIPIIECDLQDVHNQLAIKVGTQDIDTCYFLAWNGLSNENLEDYRIQIDNIRYMLDLMNEAKKMGCHTFIGAGSITQQELFTEEGRSYLTDKHKYYRVAQQACQDMGMCLAKTLDMTFIWPLITNIYGEGETSPRFINTLIRKLLSNENVPTSEGEQLYDFVYIEDAVNAYIALGEMGIGNRKYIIGSGSPKPLKDFLIIVEKQIKSQGQIEYGKFKYNGVYFTEDDYDISNLREDTGYNALTTFNDGIRNTINWIEKR